MNKPELNKSEKREAFQKKIENTYKSEIINRADAYKRFLRFSSGIFSLDLALGGGFPFGQMSLVHGSEHSGKTLIATQSMKAVQEYCTHCHLHHSLCKCDEFEPCVPLFIDVENKFDRDWALFQGLSPDTYFLATPEYGEQVVDIIESAIYSEGYDLIVLDSLAALCPIQEIESSAEDTQVGLAARMLNKAFRKWVRALIKSENKPHLLLINQNRYKVGISFGDPTTLPGGQAQKFHTSIHISTKPPKIASPKEGAFPSVAELGGRTTKNGTFTPRIQFTYKLGIRDSSELHAGEINNAEQIFNYAKIFNLIEEGYRYGECEGKTYKKLFADMQNRFQDKDVLYRYWMGLLEKGCCGIYQGNFTKTDKEWWNDS